jgi:hypothetical protein
MAQKVLVVLIDDLDGTEASETINFAVDGNTYEIDLTAAHAGELREALAPWVGHARKIAAAAAGARAGSGSGGRKRARIDAGQLQDMRRWARENGYQVSGRGRISQEIQRAYQAAHASG